MVSGEEDGTIRIKSVVQYTASELHQISYGRISALSLTEEGSEEHAGDWDYHDGNYNVSDEDTLIKTGSYALKVEYDDFVNSNLDLKYELSEMITWGNFVSLEMSFSKGVEDSLPEVLRIYLEMESGETVEHVISQANIASSTTEYTDHVILKGDFSSVDSSITSTTNIKYVIMNQYSFGYQMPTFWYTDAINFNYTGGYEPIGVDSDGNLQVDVLGAIPSTIGVGQNTDIDATAEQLTEDSTACKYVIVQADKDNTDKIYIGDSNVDEDKGIGLDPLDSVTIAIDNINKIYAIGVSADQAVHWMFVK